METCKKIKSNINKVLIKNQLYINDIESYNNFINHLINKTNKYANIKELEINFDDDNIDFEINLFFILNNLYYLRNLYICNCTIDFDINIFKEKTFKKLKYLTLSWININNMNDFNIIFNYFPNLKEFSLDLYILNNVNNNDVVNLSLNDNNNIKLINIDNGPYNYDISISKCNSIESLTFTSCREDDEIHWNKLNLINLPNLKIIYSNTILSAKIIDCIKLESFTNIGIVLDNKIIIKNSNLTNIYVEAIFENDKNKLIEYNIDFNNNILEQINKILDIFNMCDNIINIKISNLLSDEDDFDYIFNQNLNLLELSLEEQKNIISKVYYHYTGSYYHGMYPVKGIIAYDKKFICYQKNNFILILN